MEDRPRSRLFYRMRLMAMPEVECDVWSADWRIFREVGEVARDPYESRSQLVSTVYFAGDAVYVCVRGK